MKIASDLTFINRICILKLMYSFKMSWRSMFELIVKIWLFKARPGKILLVACWLALIFPCASALPLGTAHAITTQTHDEYCSCGPKCRREKCCCKPAEPELTQLQQSPGHIQMKANRDNKLYCLITSPCSEPPANSEVRSTRVLLPTALLVEWLCLTQPTSGPLVVEFTQPAHSPGYLSQVERPPELQFY